MRRRIGRATAVAPVLVGILVVASNAAAIDGLPIGVELTNADVGTVGWIRVADDDGVADGLVELVTSNDACLPFTSNFETGDLSEWSSTGG